VSELAGGLAGIAIGCLLIPFLPFIRAEYPSYKDFWRSVWRGMHQ
jgi:hypothetical protein